MDVWRICRAKYEASAFTGDGAEKTGGRWNLLGHPMVYPSENLSLAALELFVRVSPDVIPHDLIAVRGILPDAVSTLEIDESTLPDDWRNYPSPKELQEVGTNWLRAMTSLTLIVPSAINSLEKNILLNPSHPEMEKLSVEAGIPFRFDPRMFGK